MEILSNDAQNSIAKTVIQIMKERGKYSQLRGVYIATVLNGGFCEESSLIKIGISSFLSFYVYSPLGRMLQSKLKKTIETCIHSYLSYILTSNDISIESLLEQ